MPLFPGGAAGGSRRHYEALELDPNATPEEVKRAYRRLALQHHPDKGGSPEKFKEISTAHNILSDPQKREIYDKYGEEGLNILDSGWFGEEGSEILPYIMNPHFYGIVLLIALLLISLVILVPVFIVIQTDHAVHWSWGVVFIPLWILLLVNIGLGVGIFVVSKQSSKLSAAKYLIHSILISLFFAFVCARLDGASHWDAAGYLAPLYAIELWNAISLLKKSNHASYVNEAQGGEGATKRSYLGLGVKGYIFRVWFWWIHRVWFLIFLTVQLDYGDWSWWIPAVPIIVALGLGFILKLVDDRAAANAPHREGDEDEAKGGSALTSLLICLLGSLAIVFLGLLAAHLNSGKFSVAVVFIPVFIVLGLVACCSYCCLPCICCCLARGGPDQFGADEENQRSPFGGIPDLFPRQRLIEKTPLISS